jgi:cytochrome b561
MRWKNTASRYGDLQIVLHWLMFVLLIAVYLTMELRGYFPRGSDTRAALKEWHYMLGLSVLALLVVRLVARWSGPAPHIVPPLPAWQTLLSRLLHLTLYALMIGMPLAGWLILSGEGHEVPFWGLTLPPLAGPDRALAENFEEWHELGAEAGYWLLGLHSAAALYHHYVSRDNTLTRMVPRRSEPATKG